MVSNLSRKPFFLPSGFVWIRFVGIDRSVLVSPLPVFILQLYPSHI